MQRWKPDDHAYCRLSKLTVPTLALAGTDDVVYWPHRSPERVQNGIVDASGHFRLRERLLSKVRIRGIYTRFLYTLCRHFCTILRSRGIRRLLIFGRRAVQERAVKVGLT